jgi:hypothetical protein
VSLLIQELICKARPEDLVQKIEKTKNEDGFIQQNLKIG